MSTYTIQVHILMVKRIHTSLLTEVIGSYILLQEISHGLVILSHDFMSAGSGVQSLHVTVLTLKEWNHLHAWL